MRPPLIPLFIFLLAFSLAQFTIHNEICLDLDSASASFSAASLVWLGLAWSSLVWSDYGMEFPFSSFSSVTHSRFK